MNIYLNRSIKITLGSMVTFNLISSFSAYCNPVEFKTCVVDDLKANSKIYDANNKEIKFQLRGLYALFVKSVGETFYFKIFHKKPEYKYANFFHFYNYETAAYMSTEQLYWHLSDGFYDIETKQFKKPSDFANIDNESFKDVCLTIENNIYSC